LWFYFIPDEPARALRPYPQLEGRNSPVFDPERKRGIYSVVGRSILQKVGVQGIRIAGIMVPAARSISSVQKTIARSASIVARVWEDNFIESR
jgi:hypothetical protein